MAAQGGSMTVIRWVLDTRPLWPEAQKTKDLTTAASDALAVLSDEEREQVLRFYFVKDAKLALGSALLKRLAISRLAGVAWADAAWTRDERTKPVFRLPDGSEPVRFNVSHQAGIVALVAVQRPDAADASIAVGVDVVCRTERRDRDRASVAADGWAHYVAVHDEVFSPAEAARLVALPADHYHGRRDAASDGLADDVDWRLAYFYALWCLREAYIKMTGDALLAPWLRDLEMRYFAPPGHVPPEGDRRLEIWFRGRRVDDVHMRLEPLLRDYMLCTAVRCGSAHRAFFEAQVAQPATILTLQEIMAGAQAGQKS